MGGLAAADPRRAGPPVERQAGPARDLAEAARDGARTPAPRGGRTIDGPLCTEPERADHRELEVLRLVGRGQSNREIATELFISEHTAANHVRSILMKTQSANRTAAARYAMRHGVLEEGSDDGDLSTHPAACEP